MIHIVLPFKDLIYILSFQGSNTNFHLKLKYAQIVSGTTQFDPNCHFEDLTEIFTLAQIFLSVQMVLKNCIWYIMVWPILPFQRSYTNFHWKFIFFGVQKFIQKIVSGAIWFDPYCPFKDHTNVHLILIYLLVLKIYWRIVSGTEI